MNTNTTKVVLFLVGSALMAAATVPQFVAFAPALTGFGGTLIGWSGLRRPGDAPAVKP